MTEEEIAALQKTNTDLVARVGQLESINTDLVDQKKELKKKLENGITDDQLKAELDNYKNQLSTVEADKAELEGNYKKELNTLNMVNQLKAAGVEAHNEDAFNSIAQLVLDGAEFEDGAFKYQNEDGTTRFNQANAAYSITDKVEELRGSEKSYFFKQPTGGGGGKLPVIKTPENLVKTKMSVAEKLDYRSQHGEEAYAALPMT